MASSQIQLSVRWPDKRAVKVTVHIEPLVGDRLHLLRTEDGVERVESAERIASIDSDQLESETVLLEFLAGLTRREADGATIEAVIFEPDVDRFLTLLGADDGPAPDPLVVKVPGSG